MKALREDPIQTDLSDLTCTHGEDGCPIFNEINELKRQFRELQSQATRDFLTDLFNVHYFKTTLEKELERTKRTHLPTTLVLFDVDHFKKFNDTYGHVTGDKVLQHIARLLRSTVRKIDIPCRYGGEEFAVILPSTPMLIGAQVAERIRESIADSVIAHEDTTLTVTASFGVDAYQFSSSDSVESFIHRVDTQLYASKAAGRNCVSHASIKADASRVTDEEKDALFFDEDTPIDSLDQPSEGTDNA